MQFLDLFQLKIIDVIEKRHTMLWRNPHILAFGRGFKIINGFLTKIPCLTIFVKEKLPLYSLNSFDIIPTNIEGVITDVVESGKALPHSCEIRPALGGISVANVNRKGGGTIAYAVTDKSNKLYILSCGHVLCRDIVNIVCNDKIIQPSLSKGGNIITSSIGTLERWIPLKISENPPENINDYNDADAAIAFINYNTPYTHKSLLSPRLTDGTIIKGTSLVEPTDAIWKIGASTQKTYGKVLTVNTVFFIESSKGKAYFKNQIIADMKSSFGDSGALGVIKSSNKAFGLLLAGSKPNATFFSPIDKILNLLNVKLTLPIN